MYSGDNSAVLIGFTMEEGKFLLGRDFSVTTVKVKTHRTADVKTTFLCIWCCHYKTKIALQVAQKSTYSVYSHFLFKLNYLQNVIVVFLFPDSMDPTEGWKMMRGGSIFGYWVPRMINVFSWNYLGLYPSLLQRTETKTNIRTLNLHNIITSSLNSLLYFSTSLLLYFFTSILLYFSTSLPFYFSPSILLYFSTFLLL